MTALRVDLNPDDVGRGFTALVLALAEAVRELLERQAVRRIEAGDLSPEQIERLGSTLLAVRQQLTALREQLEIESDRKDTS
jgi:hypothetical protein